jgi:hypothetical protein
MSRFLHAYRQAQLLVSWGDPLRCTRILLLPECDSSWGDRDLVDRRQWNPVHNLHAFCARGRLDCRDCFPWLGQCVLDLVPRPGDGSDHQKGEQYKCREDTFAVIEDVPCQESTDQSDQRQVHPEAQVGKGHGVHGFSSSIHSRSTSPTRRPGLNTPPLSIGRRGVGVEWTILGPGSTGTAIG